MLVLCVLSGALFAAVHASLRSVEFWSGWMLLLTVVALGVFNVRKKLPFLPLGNATAWMEFHVYAGLFSVFLFLSHVGFVIPQGSMEWMLAALFA